MDHGRAKSTGAKTFAELEAVLARSLIARVVMATADGLRSAFDSSQVVSRMAKLSGELVSYSHADRLRVIGAVIVSFGSAMAVLMAMVPLASSPALPWSLWLVIAVGGAALIAAADAFARAWAHRRRRG